MSAEQTERIWSGIDVAKVIAGTLAAVTAAVCASVLGVTGTLIGAGVASLVGTVGQELYARSLTHGYRRLRDTRTDAVPHSASAATPGTVSAAASIKDTTVDSRPPSASRLRSTAARTEVPAGSTHLRTAAHSADAQRAPRPQRVPRPRWRRIAVATLAAFVLAMIAVSAVELLSGRSLASMFGNESAGGTTISSVVDGPKQPKVTTPAPAGSSTAPQAPDATATTTESAEPSPSVTTNSAGTPASEPTTKPAPAVKQIKPAVPEAPAGAR